MKRHNSIIEIDLYTFIYTDFTLFIFFFLSFVFFLTKSSFLGRGVVTLSCYSLLHFFSHSNTTYSYLSTNTLTPFNTTWVTPLTVAGGVVTGNTVINVLAAKPAFPSFLFERAPIPALRIRRCPNGSPITSR